MIHKTLFEYASKNKQKERTEGTLLADNENDARTILTSDGSRLDYLRAILSREQKELLISLNDLTEISYYNDITKPQRGDFYQLIWQGYVTLKAKGISKFIYKISDKGIYLINKNKNE